jgi:hypothetical protein
MSAEINAIATSSIHQGLDFACSLLSNAIAAAGQSEPARPCPSSTSLQARFSFDNSAKKARIREPLVAWTQMKWLASACGFEGDDLARLGLPECIIKTVTGKFPGIS